MSERVDAIRKLVAIASGGWSDPDNEPAGGPPGTCAWGGCDDLADF